MDNISMNDLRKRALDIAMEGRSEAEAMTQLIRDFPGDHVSGAAIRTAVDYAYTGGESGISMTPQEKQTERNYTKRRARKGRAILYRHYDKEDLQTSLADCLADLLHMQEQSEGAVDWDAAMESAAMHFNAELIGGEHG